MVKVDRMRRERPETIDPPTAEAAKRLKADVKTWYLRGQQAPDLSYEGTEDVGQAMQTLDAEVGTRA